MATIYDKLIDAGFSVKHIARSGHDNYVRCEADNKITEYFVIPAIINAECGDAFRIAPDANGHPMLYIEINYDRGNRIASAAIARPYEVVPGHFRGPHGLFFVKCDEAPSGMVEYSPKASLEMAMIASVRNAVRGYNDRHCLSRAVNEALDAMPTP